MRFDDYLGRTNTRDLLLQRHFWLVCVELRHGKFACSDIDIGYAYGITSRDEACEEIIAFSCQHGRVDYRARCNDTQNFAVDESFRKRWIARLFADSHAIPFTHQSSNVAIGSMMGHACHG